MDNRSFALIAKYEGLSLKPYQCPAGRWSIGYGSTKLLDGTPVTANTAPLTQQQADALLMHTIESLQGEIHKVVKVTLTPNQLAALTSLSYNIGISNFRGSTLLKELNAGHLRAASEQFLRWVHCGARVLPGLVVRRRAEKDLFDGA